MQSACQNILPGRHSRSRRRGIREIKANHKIKTANIRKRESSKSELAINYWISVSMEMSDKNFARLMEPFRFVYRRKGAISKPGGSRQPSGSRQQNTPRGGRCGIESGIAREIPFQRTVISTRLFHESAVFFAVLVSGSSLPRENMETEAGSMPPRMRSFAAMRARSSPSE